MHINEEVCLATDTATIAIFDPAIMNKYSDEEGYWYEYLELKEFRSKDVLLIGTGADGYYKVRLATGDLQRPEKDFCVQVCGELGFLVTSGKLMIGAGEDLPGFGNEVEDSDGKFYNGKFISVPNGYYRVTLYEQNFLESTEFWNSTDKELPADLVIQIHEIVQMKPTVKEVTSEVRFTDDIEYQFEVESRKIGPIEGMRIKTIVVKRDGELKLKAGGPMEFKLHCDSLSGYSPKDKVEVEVISVDRKNDSCYVKIVS